MNQTTDTNLPGGLLAGHAAVAALAAIGTLSVLPDPMVGERIWIAFPALTVLFGAGLVFAGRWTAARASYEAARGATTDPETGLATPATAERVLALEFAAAERGRPLTLVMFRAENLKEYTRRHGGLVTRQFLRLAARTLRRHQRRMHLTAHAGEEGVYLSVLGGMEPDGACTYAQRVRRDVVGLRGLPGVPPVSVGVAAFDLSMGSPEELRQRAERALAKSADTGGKVVVVGQLTTDLVD